MITPEKFLQIVKDNPQKPTFKLGEIDPNYTSGDPCIIFDGETTVSTKRYKTVGYTPVAGDRVVLACIAGTYLVLGKVGSSGSSSGEPGVGLQFQWDGTYLGVKREDQAEYVYVDLQGSQGLQGIPGINGKNLEFLWDGTQLGVRQEGQTVYQYVNLQGPPGLSYTHPDSHPASMISVDDADEHFQSNPKTAENVLSELFTSVNNGKTLIAAAITDKGVTTNGSDTFVTMANNISQISSSGFDLVAGNSQIYIQTDTKRRNLPSMAKVREVKVLKSGSIRVTFNLALDATHTTSALGRIYKNGIAVGTLRTVNGITYVEFTEDFAVNENDLIQLYLGKTLANTYNARNSLFIIGVDATSLVQHIL